MMPIPFKSWFFPEKWVKIASIMLEKDAGNKQYHHLRIPTLFESSFNQIKWILIGCKLMHYPKDKG
jgi:hypothetical protein